MKRSTKNLLVAMAILLGTALFSSCATEYTVAYYDYPSGTVHVYPYHYNYYGGTYYWCRPYYQHHFRPMPPRPNPRPFPPKPNSNFHGSNQTNHSATVNPRPSSTPGSMSGGNHHGRSSGGGSGRSGTSGNRR